MHGKRSRPFRHPTHPAEIGKESGPGTHSLGIAGDIEADGRLKYLILQDTYMHRVVRGMSAFAGIGIARSFIHVDIAKGEPGRPRPWVWTY